MQKTRKRGRLAARISLVVTAIAIAMVYLVGTIVTNSMTNMYIESHNEQIRQELTECKNLFMNPEITGWVLDQWQQNEKEMLETEFEETEEAEDSNIMRAVMEVITLQDIEEMDSDSFLYFLKRAYQHVADSFRQRRSEGRFDRAIVIDIRNDDDLYGEDKDDYYLVLKSDEETDASGDCGLGTYLDREDTYLDLHALQYGTYGKDYGDVVFQRMNDRRQNTLFYMAEMPVFVDGVLRYVICLEYNWSNFARLLDASLDHIALWGTLSLVSFNILLYLFIYLKAVRPLTQINNGMLEYIRTKDSAKAEENMGKIRETNEIGLLADNFSALTREIDRYTAENLDLTRERQRVSTELELAARIQADSLSTDFPERPEFSMFALMDPAKEVGGDFYDFFFTDENHLGLVIADVSGKGVPAALFMMMAKNMIRNYALAGLSPGEVMNRTNESLCENNKNGMFLTAWFGLLDLRTGRVAASNAGHEYPMLREADAPFELFREKHNIPLGIARLKPYMEYEFSLQKGGTLFLYTDGAAEATDAEDQLFGTDRMLEALNREPDAEPEKLTENMKEAIHQFVGDAPQFDDTTMLCIKLKRTAEEGPRKTES